MEKITNLAQREISSLRNIKIISSIITNFILPSLIAILGWFQSGIRENSEILFWVIISLLIGLQVVIGFLNFRGSQLVTEAYFEAREIFEDNRNNLNQIKQLKETIEDLANVEESFSGLQTIERQSIQQGFQKRDDLYFVIKNLCSILVNGRDAFFKFEVQELWNFAVYIYDDNEGLLIPVWRKKNEYHPATGEGRKWEPGQGHIGKAFADRRSKITKDATDPDVADIMRAPESKFRNYDERVYCSFASIPIGPVEDNSQPFGVLVATSNKVNRFNKANCLILKHVANTLANVIYLNNTKLNEF